MEREERLRGRRLQMIRRRHFKKNPLCVHCMQHGIVRAATELDHIVPLFRGGKDEADNRQGLCKECHVEKSVAEMNRRRRFKIGEDGYPIAIPGGVVANPGSEIPETARLIATRNSATKSIV